MADDDTLRDPPRNALPHVGIRGAKSSHKLRFIRGGPQGSAPAPGLCAACACVKRWHRLKMGLSA
jgi:hypothetical protein